MNGTLPRKPVIGAEKEEDMEIVDWLALVHLGDLFWWIRK